MPDASILVAAASQLTPGWGAKKEVSVLKCYNTFHGSKTLFNTRPRDIEGALASRADAAEFAAAVTPAFSEIVLPPRQSLSIFGLAEVDALIASRGVQHLILAGPLGDLTLDSSLRDLHVTVVSDCIGVSSPAALELEVRYTMPLYGHLVTGLANLERLTGGCSDLLEEGERPCVGARCFSFIQWWVPIEKNPHGAGFLGLAELA